MRKKFSLSQVFEMQENLIHLNVKVWEKRFLFIKACIELIMNTSRNKKKSMKHNNKISIFNHIFRPGVSTNIVSTKLLLYGLPHDALCILRLSLESFICCEYMIELDAFDELRRVIIKREDLQKNIKKYCKKLKDKDGQIRLPLWGDLSNMGSHLTFNRFLLNKFAFENEYLTRIGMGILDKKTAFDVSNHLIFMNFFMVDLEKSLFEKISCPEVLPNEFYNEYTRLKKQYRDFHIEAAEIVKKWEEEDLKRKYQN